MFNILGYDREIFDRVLNESLAIPLGLKKKFNYLQLMFIFFEEVSKGWGNKCFTNISNYDYGKND